MIWRGHKFFYENPEGRYLDLEVTSICNLSCSYCVNGFRNSHEIMTTELLYKILSDYLKYTKNIPTFYNITGGEPFIRNDLDNVVNIVQNDNEKNIVTIQTNASCVDEKIVKNFHNKNRIFIEAAYHYESCYIDRFLKTIDMLLENDIEFIIKCIYENEKKHEAYKLIELFSKYKLEKKLQFFGNNKYDIDYESINDIIEYFNNYKPFVIIDNNEKKNVSLYELEIGKYKNTYGYTCLLNKSLVVNCFSTIISNIGEANDEERKKCNRCKSYGSIYNYDMKKIIRNSYSSKCINSKCIHYCKAFIPCFG